MSTDMVSVLFQSGDEKLTMQGNPELMIRVLKGLGVAGETLKLIPNGQGAELIKPIGTVQRVEPIGQKPKDFLAFYRQINPQSQTDQILVITYYYQKYDGLENLSLEDYEKAYTLLRRIPIEKPSNVKSSIGNVVNRTEYLRNAERGQYLLTMTGEDHVDALIAEKQSA